MLSNAVHDWMLEAAGGGGDVPAFFAELGITLPNKDGEAPIRCFANPSAHNRDDRNASCSVNLRTGTWHCKGCGERGNAYRAAQIAGRTDREAADLARRFGLFLGAAKDKKEKSAPPRLPTETQLKKWRHAFLDNKRVIARLQEVKGWTPYAMGVLGLGWDGERVTFAIRNQKHKVVGVVRYLPGGDPKTKAVPGSKRDLFPAPERFYRKAPLWIVEGEPDAVAMRSLGLRATAVPGTGSWRSEWGRRFWGRRVMVLCDCDAQGRGLAERIATDCQGQVLDLEPGRSDGFDVGDVVREASREGGLVQVRRWFERAAA